MTCVTWGNGEATDRAMSATIGEDGLRPLVDTSHADNLPELELPGVREETPTRHRGSQVLG